MKFWLFFVIFVFFVRFVVEKAKGTEPLLIFKFQVSGWIRERQHLKRET